MGNHNTGFEIDAAVRHRRLLGFTAAGLLAGGLALGGLIAALQALAPDVSYRPAIALGLYAVIAGAMLFGLRHHAPHRRLGLANAITLARAVLTCLLAGLLLTGPLAPPAGWAAVVTASVALALDGFDGWAARRNGLSSRFGARFDMEIDALLLVVLSALVLELGKAGPWVLLIGLMRYLFVAAARPWPWLRAELPPSLRRKTVCVVAGVVLTVCLAPIIPPPLSTVLAAAALALLTISFGIDIRWLYHHHRQGDRAWSPAPRSSATPAPPSAPPPPSASPAPPPSGSPPQRSRPPQRRSATASTPST